MAAVLQPFINEDLTKDATLLKTNSGSIVFCSSETIAGAGLVFSGNAVNTQTVTIDGKVYTFLDTVGTNDGNVHIGASAAASITNLFNAIIKGTGAGTDYGVNTTLHPTVNAGFNATTLFAFSKRAGIIGNSIAVSETLSAAAWSVANLVGGAPTPNNGDRNITLTLPQDDVDGGNYEFIFRDNGRSKDSSNRDYFTSWTISSGLTKPFQVSSSSRATNPYNSRSLLKTKGATLEGVKLGGRVNNGPGGTVLNYEAGESIKFVSWGGVWYATAPFGTGFYGIGDF